MENYFTIKAQVRAELQEEFKQKLADAKNEMERALEQGYNEAYQMLLAERRHRENLEARLDEEYEKKVAHIKDYIVGKVDAFLSVEWKKLREAGDRELADKLAAWRTALSASEMVTLALGDGKDFKKTSGAKEDDDYPRPNH